MLLNKIFYPTFFMLLIACCIGLNETQAQQPNINGVIYTQIPCDHDGIITATVTGGTLPYSYTWNYGIQNQQQVITTTNTLGNMSGERVNLIVTDALGQSGYFWWYMMTSAFPFDISLGITNAICPLNNGAITATITGGTSPFVYSWYNNGSFLSTSTNPTINNLSPGGSYDVKVIDANGCSLYYSEFDSLGYVSVQNSVATQANLVKTAANCINGTATVNPTGGTAPYTYAWQETSPNSNLLPSTTNIATNLIASHWYKVIITDANACVKQQNFNMTTNLTYSAQSQVTPEHCDDNDGTAMAIPTGNASSPYTYSWNTTPPQITQTASGLGEGFYECYITSANGCVTTIYSTVPVVSPVNVTYSSTGSNNCNNPNGTSTLTVTGGTPPYTYSWANGQTTQTATGLAKGSYYFEVTDATGCSKSGYALVGQINPINATATVVQTSSCNTPNGQSTISAYAGTSPYTYSWSNGQTTQTATGLNIGNSYYSVTDATGCIYSDYVTISYTGNLQLGITTTPDVCTSGNGTATATVNGGASPYSYTWLNGQNTSAISNLNQGVYYCTIADANGCTKSNYGFVNYFTPITISATVSNASCLYIADGSITLSASGGTAPYTYHMLNGGITQSSPVFTGLLADASIYFSNHYFSVTDANGCTAYSNGIYLGYNNILSCVGTIAGVVYDDANQNCVQDAGETGIPNTMVSCSGFGSVFTNNAGYYSFTVPVGTYNVNHYPTIYHKAKCPVSGMQSVNMPLAGTIVNADFADSTTLVADLRAGIYSVNSPTPGFNYAQHFIYQNVGTIPVANTEPRLVYDNELSINSISPSPSGTIYTPEEQTFGSMTLQPTTYFDVNANYYVPTNVPLGTVLTYQDTAFPVTGDTTFWNNYHFYQPVVTGSYDPNYKEVSPKGEGAEGFITINDSVLEYVIHFQNTGTAPAHNITLIDTLDTDLELISIEMGYSTHNYVAKISENRALEIYFPNIMLPDSGADMVGSNGLVAFRIKQKKNLPFGTKFTNQAGIIFDFNYPIYTNTTLNTLHELTSVEKPIIETLGLFPNPAQNVLNIEIPYDLQGQDLTFECLDLTGKVVMSKQNIHAGKTEISVAELPQGWYFARVVGKNTLLNGKFVIVR